MACEKQQERLLENTFNMRCKDQENSCYGEGY